MKEPISTEQKALKINLDSEKFGTFAEIGAGQEVVRWSFHVGRASTTVAKSISAYDTAVSDELYGSTQHYVSRQRLTSMLDREYALLLARLDQQRGDKTAFFAFADTAATHTRSGQHGGHAWLGVRFQAQPRSDPSEVVIHVQLHDAATVDQQAALGILGVNLTHAAFFHHSEPDTLISELMDGLRRERAEVDMIKVSGLAFAGVDNRVMSLQLVEQDLTDAVLFTVDGEVEQASEVLSGKPVLMERGTFRPVTNVTKEMLDRSLEQLGDSGEAERYSGGNPNGIPGCFRTETEMLFESILREDRSAVDLLNADYTFVNERLARHYGIPNVYGEQFHKVKLDGALEVRRGLLGQGSIQLVTSLANRTSPVQRGKWVLMNILGIIPPEAPPNVPALKDGESTASERTLDTTIRERMEAHRANAVCASCHRMMDPIGFSLESFDAVGKYRTTEFGHPIDTTGQLVDGTKFRGPEGLRQALLQYSPQFVQVLTEKLMTYALGRGVEYYDMPVIRAINRQAALKDNHLSAIVLEIVKSAPFQMTVKPPDTVAAAKPDR